MKRITSLFVGLGILAGAGLGLTACSEGAHAHVWDGGRVTLAATCSQEGVKTYNCTVKGCKETTTEQISKLPHAWDSGEVTLPPTCTDIGEKTFGCENCDATYTEQIDKTEHAYDGGRLTTVPDLTEAGEVTYTCADCNAQKTQPVAPRADFGEQFTTGETVYSWGYGAAENYRSETGEFDFVAAQPEGDKFRADGVEISADGITAVRHAAVSYSVLLDTEISVKTSFSGSEEGTEVAAKIIVKDGLNAVKEIVEINAGAIEWEYSGDESIPVNAGDCLYVVFENVGEGAPSGRFALTFTAACRHVWNSGEVTAPATCTTVGAMTYTCENCFDTRTEDIPLLPHDFTGGWISDGAESHHKQCKNCQAEDASMAHVWGADPDKEDIEATCHSDGTRFLKCECGEETSQTITERPAHDFAAWVNTDPAEHWRVCAVEGCGAEEARQAHAMVDNGVKQPATAEEDGIMNTLCSVCGYESTRPIPAFGEHVKGDALVYEEGGSTHWYACTAHDDCQVKLEEETHRFDEELTEQRVPATCAQDGKSVWQCVCGALEERVIDKSTVEHGWDEGRTTTEPTFWAAGERTYTCSVCGQTRTEEIAALNGTSSADGFESQCGWQYGVTDYHFKDGENEEHYEFKPITQNNGDAFAENGTEIKKDWFAAGFDTFVTIAFTFESDVKASVDVTFKGIGGDDGILSEYAVRIGVKDKDGNMYSLPSFKNGTDFSHSETHEFKAGDTVYIMFKHEKNGWDQGNYSVNINKVA